VRRLSGLIIVLALLSFAAVPLFSAEEDLFDSKTAKEHLEKGLSYLKARNYRSAVTALEESIANSPDADAYYYLGYAYYLIGRSGDAESRKKSIECFDKAYELNPAFTPAREKTEEIPQRVKQKVDTAPSAASTASDQEQPSALPAAEGNSR
jgi:tetratricopeptide (TPR) repeat protein